MFRCIAIAWFAGKVHGVVVQISTLMVAPGFSLKSRSLDGNRTTGKPMNAARDRCSLLYSSSDSARAVFDDGDQ